MGLDCLALVCIPGSHGTVAIEEIVLGRLPSPHPGYCADSRLRYKPQSFWKGGLLVCPGPFGLSDSLQVWYMSCKLQICSLGM